MMHPVDFHEFRKICVYKSGSAFSLLELDNNDKVVASISISRSRINNLIKELAEYALENWEDDDDGKHNTIHSTD